MHLEASHASSNETRAHISPVPASTRFQFWPRLFPGQLPAPFMREAPDCTFHPKPLYFMVSAFCTARDLLEAGFGVAALSLPICGEQRKPGFAATPSSLVGMDLISSQQHGAHSSALIFGIYLQMPCRKRLRALVVRRAINHNNAYT